MMGYYGAGAPAWMWIVGTLMMLVFWGGLAALIVWVVRAVTTPRDGGASAEEILKRRLAAGQITQEDYEKTRRALQS